MAAAPFALRLPKLALAPLAPRQRAEALVDRLVRGRAWIPVLAMLLVGIVAMQVEVLKLGASVGRSTTLIGQLQGQNEVLRATNSGLESPSRIERLASHLGMSEPGPTDIHFLAGASVTKAINAITAPNASAFSQQLAAEQQSDDTSSSTANSAANAAETNDAASNPTASDNAAAQAAQTVNSGAAAAGTSAGGGASTTGTASGLGTASGAATSTGTGTSSGAASGTGTTAATTGDASSAGVSDTAAASATGGSGLAGTSDSTSPTQ